MSFQVFSRNNDKDGNAYRLVLVYNQSGSVDRCYESRSSEPYQLDDLRLTHIQLPGFRLSPSEYKNTKDAFKRWLVEAD